MVYKLNGEQPFQVLSSDFSISPSESGYELYFSADGFNYTSFATVGAGVTRQFTSMSAGNYYKLMGNTGEVSVNWERDCCGGQGGGGVAGVSSLNGQTGALTTKTINGNDILGTGDITIEGGDSVYYLGNNQNRLVWDSDTEKLYLNGTTEVQNPSGVISGAYGWFNLGWINLLIRGAKNGNSAPYGLYNFGVVEGGTTKMLIQPSISLYPLASSVTIDEQTYSQELYFDYGEWGFKIYINNEFPANFRIVHKSGGSGEQNYVIVESLSAITEPYEGMLAFVPEHNVSETFEFIKAYFVGVEHPEDYLGRFRRISDSGETRSIYQSGSNFYWDPWQQYNGQYSFHNVTIEGNYKTLFRPYNDSENPGNSWIEFTMPDGMFFEVHNDGANGATTSVTSETITTLIPNTFYQYNGSSWDKLDVKKKYFLNTMTNEERLALYNDIDTLIAKGTSINEMYSFYADFGTVHSDNKVPQQIKYLMDTGTQKWFVGFAANTYNPSEIWALYYKINSDGSDELNMSPNYSYEAKNAKILGGGDRLRYSITDGSIKINDNVITNYTGTTCSGNLSEVSAGSLRTYLDGGWGPQMFYNILEIYSGDTKVGIANNPSISYAPLSPSVTCTDPESNQIDFDVEVRYDYGKYLFACWLSSTNEQKIANVSFTIK